MLRSQEDLKGVKFAGGVVQMRIHAAVVAVESEAATKAKESKAGEHRQSVYPCRMRRAQRLVRWMVMKLPMDCE